MSDPKLLRRQLVEHGSTIKGAIAGNLINGVVSVFLFVQLDNGGAVVGFAGGLLLLIFWRMRLARAILMAQLDLLKLNFVKKMVIANGIAFGGFWGGAVATMLATGGHEFEIFAGIIGAGMMAAGAISYRTVEHAALGYIFSCAVGGFVGLFYTGHDGAYAAVPLLLCYLGVLTLHIRHSFSSFVAMYERELEVGQSHDTIKLLLNNYTEQGSDWLIEVDQKGAIVNPTSQLATALQQPSELLGGKKLMEVLDSNEHSSELRDHFKCGRSVRNHLVSLNVHGERHWWSISGRPVKDGEIAYRGVISDVTAQRRAEEKVSYMAHYDSLTDLPNRLMFNHHLEHKLRRDETVALMYMDLDHFKSINDTLGHGVGDLLLKAVARRTEECLSNHEFLARLGGDEFAILVDRKRLQHTKRLAKRVIDAMNKPFSLGDHDVVIGASIGIANAPEHGTTDDIITRNADLALYAAKGAGRNRAVLFEPGMDKAAQQRRLLEMDLRSALGKREMRLHYQPLINVKTGGITGYEALLRWEHPERGVVMPTAFIPVAEETGLIIQLGEWVLRQALHDLKTWPEDISVSINLSPAQMRSPSLISTLIHTLAQTGVSASRICLEITETVLMQDSKANIETLHKLRDLGVHIALDDFGTGYSSLNYLRSFPFSKIKIDRCFISEIDTREDCRAIVRSVVTLANSLGMATTAEGVEREEQMDQLRLEGCGEVQGYLFSKALPLEELSDLRRPKDLNATAPLPFEQSARKNKITGDASEIEHRRSA